MQATEATIKEILKPYQIDIESGLDEVLYSEKLKNFNQTNLLEAIRYSVLGGGKRLRAILALLTAEAVLNSQEKIQLKTNPAYGLALALELVHAGSLIHDDLPCMDNDDLRRGKPSNHKAFGEAIALLAGDFLLCYPIEVFITETPPEYKIDITNHLAELSKLINAMIAGQAMDINFANSKKTLGQADLELMQSLKTGALLKASVVLAAKITGANLNQIQCLEIYANNIGLAFQITDDILDFTASSKELGKTAQKDEDQNKLTFVKLYGINEARSIAQRLIQEAKENIKQINLYADKLLALADYVISRSN